MITVTIVDSFIYPDRHRVIVHRDGVCITGYGKLHGFTLVEAMDVRDIVLRRGY